MTEIMKRYQNWILASLSGVLLVLSHPSFNLFPLAWIALVPLLVSIKSTSNWKSAFWLGYLTGLIFFLGLIYWIILLYPFANIFVTTLGCVALVGYISVYIGIFAVLLYQLPWQSGIPFVFVAALGWTALEWVRGWLMTGFPWGSIGYTQWNNLPAIQVASLTGVYGVGFVIVLFNAAIALLLRGYPNWGREARAMILPIIVVIASFAYGFFCLSNSKVDTTTLKVALVPGNVRQIEKWIPENFPKIFNRYIQLTQEANESEPDFIVWPETAFSSTIFLSEPDNKRRFRQMLQDGNIYLLTGVPNVTSDKKVYNSVFLISPSGKKLGSYSKIHLVPFGEYVPLSRYLPNFIQFHPYEPGKSINLIPLPRGENGQIDIGISICFESVFPNLFRQGVKQGADVMGILSNDAWFENTAAPEQHLAAAPFRSVENRVSIFRCANGGISCIIDAYGRIITPRITPDDTESFLIGDIPFRNQKKTLYTLYGNWFPMLCFVVGVLLVVYLIFAERIPRLQFGRRH
jgi:apolipoprotein N-acyltransferase